MPWSVGQLVLAENDVSRGRGWDRTVDSLSSDNSPFQAKTSELASSLQEHLLCGENLSRFYFLNDEQMDNLWDAFVRETVEESPFKDAFPMLLSEEELNQQPNQMKLTAITEFDDGLAVIFSSVRVLSLRVELERDEMSEEVSAALAGYDEIYAVKHEKTHAVDVLWIPKEGNYIDIRVEYPLGMLRQTGEYAQELMRGIVNTYAGGTILHSPENLFPLIVSMYNDPNEGIVSELAFGTTSASLKHEKMRRSKNCLRNEAYHVGGKTAFATQIEPYKLSIKYRRKIDENRSSAPELNLHSSVRSSSGTAPKLTDAVIRRCTGIDDYQLVRARVEHFLALHRAAA